MSELCINCGEPESFHVLGRVNDKLIPFKCNNGSGEIFQPKPKNTEAEDALILQKVRNGDYITKPKGCRHDWVYSNSMLTSYPPQRDKICKKCGKKERETIGKAIKMENTYDGVYKKFQPQNQKGCGKILGNAFHDDKIEVHCGFRNILCESCQNQSQQVTQVGIKVPSAVKVLSVPAGKASEEIRKSDVDSSGANYGHLQDDGIMDNSCNLKTNSGADDCPISGKKGYVLDEDCHCFCCGVHKPKDDASLRILCSICAMPMNFLEEWDSNLKMTKCYKCGCSNCGAILEFKDYEKKFKELAWKELSK